MKPAGSPGRGRIFLSDPAVGIRKWVSDPGLSSSDPNIGRLTDEWPDSGRFGT